MNYKLEEYNILRVKTYRLLEIETGEYWYPLKLFLKRVLFKEQSIGPYRDNELYNKHMKVISYVNPDQCGKRENKTWFANTEGMSLILRNIGGYKGKNKKEIMKKEMYLAEAQNFFNAPSSVNSNYIGYTPDLSDYDVWSIMCITKDTDVDKKTIWKKCCKCGFYYPYTKKYFSETRNYLEGRCKQCSGSDFVCSNKRIQYIYETGGLDLLYHLYLDVDDEQIVLELKKWIWGGGL